MSKHISSHYQLHGLAQRLKQKDLTQEERFELKLMINERRVKLLLKGKELVSGFYRRENLTMFMRLRQRLRIRE